MRRAILTTVIVMPVHDQGKMVGEKQGTITTIFEGDKTLDDIAAFLHSHRTNTTTLVFETPIAMTPPKVVQ